MTASGWAWLAAAGVLAVLDWLAIARGSRTLQRIAAPLVPAAMVLAVWQAAPAHPGVRRWLVAALALGLVAQLALLTDRRPREALVPVAAARVPVEDEQPEAVPARRQPHGLRSEAAASGPWLIALWSSGTGRVASFS